MAGQFEQRSTWRKLQTFRSRDAAQKLAQKLKRVIPGRLTILQVCGTHTWNYLRHGLPSLVPGQLRLVAGPGCPVCVTAQEDVDWLIELGRDRRCILATFGDLMRVPGSNGSLLQLRSQGCDVRLVRSPLEAVDMARSDRTRRVILAAIGFETTAPAFAATVQSAKAAGLTNFSIALLAKRLIVALPELLARADYDGLLCPGHVAAVTGANAFLPAARELSCPCAIAGFEPVDMLLGLLNLALQCRDGYCRVDNLYPRAVSRRGNEVALRLVSSTFTSGDSIWRGLGLIGGSGYRLRKELDRFAILPGRRPESSGGIRKDCLCHLVLLGKVEPPRCSLFGTVCTPTTPVGPCMVSREGTCAAFYFHRSHSPGEEMDS